MLILVLAALVTGGVVFSPGTPARAATTTIVSESFETGVGAWAGWQATVSRVRASNAPSGAYVARVVRSAGSAYSIDDRTPSVASTDAAATYAATASVAAASASAAGKQVVLVLRENTAAGTGVKWTTSAPVTLAASYQRLQVAATATAAGDTLEVYVLQARNAVAGDGFYVDTITMTASIQAPDPTPTPTPTPSPTNPAGWTPLYTQDFTTPAALGQFGRIYGAAWNGYAGLRDTSGQGTYAPDKVLSVHDSALDIYLHTENGVHLVAAPLPNGYSGTSYGRYSVRFRTDVIPGYKIAFLMWPTSDVWNDGEIDFPEGNLGGTTFYGASAIAGSYGSGRMSWDPAKPYTPTNAASWHTATTEWTPGSVAYYWDGALIGRTAIPSGVPTKPMRWTLQAETNLDGVAVPAGSAGHILVDQVRAWSYTPGTPAS
ncbi:glycoside hydrolase family 16 protein [Cryobacterium zhongshanensis]|uniref:Glycoside hydrolase family 16 protein n=1 Tax=Cryobacterium zhongshanensis TaxID=2928153 RepID=A0AA41QT14_9MICO|nr:glycoside hydrolase family 16 protein [Cryobacterium zhongshanensis]MCI4656658.1 glycoside hydrolase family 16 protein [Cryobacterium zhongshanensis]